MSRGLYIHIPFCSSLCAYCDYAKILYEPNYVERYLEALKRELESYRVKDITSLYIGGGTPSALSLNQLKKLFEIVEPYLYHGLSFTIECNIENLTEEKISLMARHHVNRVSLGIQSFSKEVLVLSNRHHHEEDVIKIINLLRKYGIYDINGDLIYGLPKQNFEVLKEDLKKMISLDLTHISTYLLGVHPHTRFYLEKVEEPSDEEARRYYDYIVSYLEKNGYRRYEVSNFARNSYQSKHNLIYWHNEEYYGIGLGASGYIGKIRYTNTRSLNDYLNGKYILESEALNIDDEIFYEIMLTLRLEEGLNLKKFNEKYHIDFISKYQEKIKPLQKEGLIEYDNSNLRVSRNHLFILDYILRRILF